MQEKKSEVKEEEEKKEKTHHESEEEEEFLTDLELKKSKSRVEYALLMERKKSQLKKRMSEQQKY